MIESQTEANKVELFCTLPTGPFVTSLVYNFLLLLGCAFCAFKTRKLPDNYNESRFISFCIYSTLVLWVTFIPAYFAVDDAFFEVMFLSLSILANASVILLCIFIPKLYAIYFVERQEMQVRRPYMWFMNRGGTRRLMVEPDNTSIMSSTNSPLAAVPCPVETFQVNALTMRQINQTADMPDVITGPV